MKIGDINPLDRRFWPDEPEPGFSVRHNKWVIENTIRKNEALRKKKIKENSEAIRERTYAIDCFFHSPKIYYQDKDRALIKYFGKRELAKLRGEEIVDNLREKLKIAPGTKSLEIVDNKGRLLGRKVADATKERES